MKKAKLYKLGNIVLSLLVILVCVYYLRNAVVNKNFGWSISDIMESFRIQKGITLLVIFLMPINWLIESLKWKYVLKETQNLTLSSAIQSVISGVSFAIITPNGIGDYGGRLLSLKKESRAIALFFNGFLSLSQLLITVVGGLIGYSFIQEFYPFQIASSILYLIGTLLVTLFLLIKVNFPYMTKFRVTRTISTISFKKRLHVLALSFTRYLVFCLQFVLLLKVFGVEMPILRHFGLISTIYLVSAIIPTGWFSNLLVRGSLSLYFFEQFGNFGEAAVLASSILWIINLLIPAIVGLFFIGKVDWLQLLKFKAT